MNTLEFLVSFMFGVVVYHLLLKGSTRSKKFQKLVGLFEKKE